MSGRTGLTLIATLTRVDSPFKYHKVIASKTLDVDTSRLYGFEVLEHIAGRGVMAVQTRWEQAGAIADLSTVPKLFNTI